MRGTVVDSLSRARTELERARDFHAQRAALTTAKAEEMAARTSSLAAATRGALGRAGAFDPDIWSSTKWPQGPQGLAHPPALGSVKEIDELGEKALVAAWRRRLPAAAAEDTRFALGVESPPTVKLPPKLPARAKQKYSDDMDHFALGTLYFYNGGDEWTHAKGWADELHGKRPPGSHVAWYGVHTFSTHIQRVTNLVLPQNNLVGPLCEDLKWMDELRTLSLQGNALTGTVPPAWSTLTSLVTLDLSHNQITVGSEERWLRGSSNCCRVARKWGGARNGNAMRAIAVVTIGCVQESVC